MIKGIRVAGINSFKGLRYNSQQFAELATFFAPPYDVIDAEMRAGLIAGNPRNIAAVTRSPEAEGESEENRYSHAAGLLASWQQEGALRPDESESLYVYEQEFSVGENVYQRLGLVAGLKLVEFGQGVHPHEETLSGAKADRRLLLEQTRTHLGQIFGLYPDETGSVNAILRQGHGLRWYYSPNLGDQRCVNYFRTPEVDERQGRLYRRRTSSIRDRP